MLLAIEALGVKHGGGATVLLDLLAAAVTDLRFERVFVFCAPKQARRFDFPVDDRIFAVECPVAERNKLVRLWWLERELPEEVRSLGCGVLICLSGCGRGGPSTPHITLIQNVLPFSAGVKTAGVAERLRMRALRHAMARSCRASARVIVQTEAMKGLVSRAFSLAGERIRVITPSIRKAGDRQKGGTAPQAMRTASPGCRLLYVGNHEPHKNVTLLLAAVKVLKVRVPELSVFLTWPQDHPAGTQSGVFCLGYLNEPDLAAAYSLADVFVMPSLQETVGLPMLEAMSAGVPVVAADLPYAREVCQNAAIFFDPRSAASLVSSLEMVLADGELRAELAAKGLALADSRCEARPYEKMLHEAILAATSQANSSRPGTA